MKTHYTIVLILALIFVVSCSQNYPEKFNSTLSQLEGEWQEAPGIGYREVWERGTDGLLGAGYMHSGETYTQTESISILISDSTLVYQATVPDQNEGRTISFPLFSHTDTSLIFVNPLHDFPNLIAYRFIGDTLLHIDVQSQLDSTMNFSLRLERTK